MQHWQRWLGQKDTCSTMGLQNNIQAFDWPNNISTSLWTRSSCSTTFSTTNTYYSRTFTCRCRTWKEGSTDAIKQARITPTDCSTTPRNPKTTVEGLARSQYKKQESVGRRSHLTIQQSSKRKPKKLHIEWMGPYIVKYIHANRLIWLRTLQGIVFLKLVNGVRLKCYRN